MREPGNGHEKQRERTRGRPGPGKQNTGRVPVAVIPCIILLTVACMAVLFYLKERDQTDKPPGLVYEANIVEGDIPGKTREERQREIDTLVEEGMLSMSINATPSGSTTGPDKTVNWLIENPSNQGKLIRVEISLEDTGEIIYETGAIPPGNYVEAAGLKEDLPPGQYSCIATFYAYKEDDESYLGQAAAQIKLVLYEGEGETDHEKTD